MKSTLSVKTQNYLIESLNQRITCNLDREFLEAFILTEAVPPTGSGGGTGITPITKVSPTGSAALPVPGVKVKKTGIGSKSTLFGDSGINMTGAMGMYGAGKVLGGLAGAARATGGLIGKMLPRAVTDLPIIGTAAKFAACSCAIR